MKRQPAARKPSRSLIPVLAAAAVLIAGAILAPHINTGKSKASVSAAADLSYVWRLLSPLSEQGVDDRRWLIRYDAAGMRSGDVLRAAGRLGLHRSSGSSDPEGDPDKEKELTGGEAGTTAFEGELLLERHTAEAAEVNGAAEQKLEGIDSTNHSDSVPAPAEAQTSLSGSIAVPVALYMDVGGDRETIVIVQPPFELTPDELEAVAGQVEAALHEAGGEYRYSFRVSGSAALEEIADSEAMQRLMDGIAEQAEARLVERYADEGGAAINETRMSPHIEASIETNGQKANLQLSVHRDSESGAADWVIGVPVITGDYSPGG